jgi:hypothetical protein
MSSFWLSRRFDLNRAEPAISVTGYALPRSNRHFEDSGEIAVCIPNKVYLRSLEIVGVQPSNLSPLEGVAIVHGPTVMA